MDPRRREHFHHSIYEQRRATKPEATMLLRYRVIMACAATMLAPPVMAQERTKWHSVAEGKGVSVVFGVPGDAESDVFRASCDKPGAPIQFWYLSDQSTLPRQRTRPDGTRVEVGAVKIVVEVDSISHQYTGRGQPEEMYGGHEIVWSVSVEDALFKSLSQGRSATFVIGGKREKPINLKGSLPHLQKLNEKCSI
jgi:hypothetical protein